MELLWDVDRAAIPQEEHSLLKNRPQRRPLTGVPVRRIDHVNLLAQDVGATNDFLMDALGFRLREQILAPGRGLRGVVPNGTPPLAEIAGIPRRLQQRRRIPHLCYWYG